MSVHPHACGDFQVLRVNSQREAGTPPRVWGLRRLIRDRRRPDRYTHACGDFSTIPVRIVRQNGTPPRVWGLLVEARPDLRLGRYTPTRVGTSWSPIPERWLGTVHPHACGDFDDVLALNLQPGGTPPRVWGLLSDHRAVRTIVRYTPTRVGTSSGALPGSALRPVHPHACGDFPLCMWFSHFAHGTPPRVWGLRRQARRQFRTRRYTPRVWGLRIVCGPGDAPRRYTPTRVGTSFSLAAIVACGSVHPHACGDFVIAEMPSSSSIGTPPRVWGLLVVAHDLHAEHRYTHACGDFVPRRLQPNIVVGTPPRVWGLLRILTLLSAPERYTPTRVGTSTATRRPRIGHSVHPHACGGLRDHLD